MKAIIIIQDPETGDKSAFETDYFDAENHWNAECMIAAILPYKGIVTFDGETWQDLEQDHL